MEVSKEQSENCMLNCQVEWLIWMRWMLLKRMIWAKSKKIHTHTQNKTRTHVYMHVHVLKAGEHDGEKNGIPYNPFQTHNDNQILRLHILRNSCHHACVSEWASPVHSRRSSRQQTEPELCWTGTALLRHMNTAMSGTHKIYVMLFYAQSAIAVILGWDMEYKLKIVNWFEMQYKQKQTNKKVPHTQRWNYWFTLNFLAVWVTTLLYQQFYWYVNYKQWTLTANWLTHNCKTDY